jgi:hypothetical protein
MPHKRKRVPYQLTVALLRNRRFAKSPNFGHWRFTTTAQDHNASTKTLREEDLMGRVMIRCPATGRTISTGIEADGNTFACSPVFIADTYCALCDTQHRWFARDAWVEERPEIAARAA